MHFIDKKSRSKAMTKRDLWEVVITKYIVQ